MDVLCTKTIVLPLSKRQDIFPKHYMIAHRMSTLAGQWSNQSTVETVFLCSVSLHKFERIEDGFESSIIGLVKAISFS